MSASNDEISDLLEVFGSEGSVRGGSIDVWSSFGSAGHGSALPLRQIVLDLRHYGGTIFGVVGVPRVRHNFKDGEVMIDENGNRTWTLTVAPADARANGGMPFDVRIKSMQDPGLTTGDRVELPVIIGSFWNSSEGRAGVTWNAPTWKAVKAA